MDLLTAPALRPLLLRWSASSAALFALLVMTLVHAGSEQAGAVVPSPPGWTSTRTAQPAWDSAYSERYPGCVSMVLWPADEVPVALVTRSAAGSVDRVPVAGLEHPAPTLAEARAIGACR